MEHHFCYILYDAGWYGNEYDDASDARHVNPDPQRIAHIANHGGLNLAEVIAYGKARGIGVFLYVNRRALERQLDELFPLYEQWGIAGVKFGFVQVGPQEWTTWIADAVRKAARCHLLVNIHDNYRPTGLTRTFPNLLTQEGIQGNEHMPNAAHNATFPFTRLPAGAADYTICIYDPRLKNSRAHQLALAVISYSPLQHFYWYDRPSQFRGEPELRFLDQVPTHWDETRVLDGRIGEFLTLARRSGADWFIGAIAGTQAHPGRINLAFLPPGRKYTAMICENGLQQGATGIRTDIVTAKDTILANLPPAGGLAVWLKAQ